MGIDPEEMPSVSLEYVEKKVVCKILGNAVIPEKIPFNPLTSIFSPAIINLSG